MDFIIGLAHWCELHGPTSILCTQVIPPSCGACYPPRPSLTRSPSTPQLAGGPTPPQSSHGYGRSNITTNTPISNPIPKPTTSYLGSSSPRLQSPSETPPGSPRSPALGTSSGGSSTGEQCRNCTMTLPKKFEEEPSPAGSTGRGVSPPGRPLRTTETVLVSTPVGAKADGERAGRGQPPSPPKIQPQFSSATQSLATHTHTVTYLSSRSPAQASRYSNVRQACIRSLSCELVPAQTGPILFGDGHTGYTIAVVFKLSDAKSRGGLRTYALLCMSMNQKALVQQWNVIETVFQNLVNEIQHAVAEKAVRDFQSSPALGASMSSVGSRGPEGFLRRRAAGDGASQKSLADLVGKDRFFVDLHSTFVRLLAALSKIYGYGSATHEITAEMMPPSIGAGASSDGRSRAGSVGSPSAGLEEPDKKHQPEQLPQASPAMSASQTSTDLVAADLKTHAPTLDRIEVTPCMNPFSPPVDVKTSAPAASNATVAASLPIPKSPVPAPVAAPAEQHEEQVPRNIESRKQIAVG